MALLFSAGKVTATNGSNTVTFSGAGLLAAHAKHGDEIRIEGGYAGFLDTLDFVTQTATIAPPYSGETGEGKSFSIRRATAISVSTSEALTQVYNLLDSISVFDAKTTAFQYLYSNEDLKPRYIVPNASSPNNVTQLSLSTLDYKSTDISALISQWTLKSLILVRDVGSNAFLAYRTVAEPVINNGVATVEVEYVGHNGSIVENSPVIVGFVFGVDYDALYQAIDQAEASAETAETYRNQAITARDSAQDAASDANNAKIASEAAQQSAEAILQLADGIAAQVQSDLATSGQFLSAAQTAKTEAETAQQAAETAQVGAESAQTSAEVALAAAIQAQGGAETALGNAETAEANTLAALQAAQQSAQQANSAKLAAEAAQTASAEMLSDTEELYNSAVVLAESAADAEAGATAAQATAVGAKVSAEAARDAAISAQTGAEAAATAAAAIIADGYPDLTALQAALDTKAAQNHGHTVATVQTDGFMSAADKAKLDNFDAGLGVALEEKADRGFLSGGKELVLTTSQTLGVATNGLVVVTDAEEALTLTLADPTILGDDFIVLITNPSAYSITVEGVFDNGEGDILLAHGQSMAVTCNGTLHRALLRGGGAAGGVTDDTFQVRQSFNGNGTAIYKLNHTPLGLDAITVFVGGSIQARESVQLDGRTLTLGADVPETVRIDVTSLTNTVYTLPTPLYALHRGNGTVGPYTLQAVPPHYTHLFVVVGGVPQPKTGGFYTVEGDQITFAEPISSDTLWEETIFGATTVGVVEPTPGSVTEEHISDAAIAAIRAKLDIGSGDGVPVGAVIFSATGAIFPGYLELNGSTFEGYPDLAALLGTNVLPDFRDRVARHEGALAGLSGTAQEDAMQRITGEITSESNAGVVRSPSYSGAFKPGTPRAGHYTGATVTSYDLTFDSGNSPGAKVSDEETRVKSYIGKYLIKAASAAVNEGTVDVLALTGVVQGKLSKDEIIGLVENGSVIERDKNANGEFVKFADGTLICSRHTSTGDIANAVARTEGTVTGGSYFDITWVFPATFAKTPCASASTNLHSGDAARVFHGSDVVNVDTGQLRVRLWSVGPLTRYSNLQIIAFGRWF